MRVLIDGEEPAVALTGNLELHCLTRVVVTPFAYLPTPAGTLEG